MCVDGQWSVQWGVWHVIWCASGLPLVFILVLELLLFEFCTSVPWEFFYPAAWCLSLTWTHEDEVPGLRSSSSYPFLDYGAVHVPSNFHTISAAHCKGPTPEPNFSLYWPAHGIVVHARDDMHSPFVHTQAPQGPPQDLSWHMIESFLKVNKGKIEPFVCSGDVFLLQLANNEDGISDARCWPWCPQEIWQVPLCCRL